MSEYTRVFSNLSLFERVHIYIKLLIILVHKTCKDWNLVIVISYFEMTKTWTITEGYIIWMVMIFQLTSSFDPPAVVVIDHLYWDQNVWCI